jgi:hypothetical protein
MIASPFENTNRTAIIAASMKLAMKRPNIVHLEIAALAQRRRLPRE